MLDPHRLRVLRAVIAAGSVNAAATSLGYTPSAISQQLTALQRETGLTLFAKAGRGITPTSAGTQLAELSGEAMNSLARLDAAVTHLREGRTEHLSIGSFASAAQAWLPEVARQLGAELPDLMLELRLSETGQAPDPEGMDIDIATEVPWEPPTSRPGHRRHELGTEPYAVVVPCTHPLAQQGSAPLAAIADEPWVEESHRDTCCGRIVAQRCSAAGVVPRVVARTNDHHTSIAFVAAGVGVAVLPRLATSGMPPEVVAVPLADAELNRRIVALVRESAEPTVAAQRALALLSDSAARSTS
ncbi:LysR family transcriptional regulator [Mariniluteicoccus flavus]